MRLIATARLGSRAMIYDAINLYDDAIHDLTTAISSKQNWIELLVDRGKVFAKEDRFDAAISDFNRAIERNGTLTWAIRERGLIPILTLSNPWLPSRGVRWT
jgi:lipoprotein NlpI